MRVRVLCWNVSYMHGVEPKLALLRRAIDERNDADVLVAGLLEVVPSARDAFAGLFDASAYSLDLRPPGPLDVATGRSASLSAASARSWSARLSSSGLRIPIEPLPRTCWSTAPTCTSSPRTR